MTRMEIKSRIGPDGVLNLSIPLGRSEANQEVVVTVQPVASPRDPQTWRRSVEETAGTIQDPTFVRHDQGAIAPPNRTEFERVSGLRTEDREA